MKALTSSASAGRRGGASSPPRIFGRRNAVEVDRVATLPAKLTALYLGLRHEPAGQGSARRKSAWTCA